MSDASQKWTEMMHTYYYYYNRFMVLCPGLPGWTSIRRNNPNSCIHSDHQPSFLRFLHLLWTLFNLRVWQSFCTTSLEVLFSLPLGLAPFTSYSIHFFTQRLSSFHNICPYHWNLFCCSTEIMLSNPSLFLNSLLGTLSFNLMSYIHLTILAHLYAYYCQQLSSPSLKKFTINKQTWSKSKKMQRHTVKLCMTCQRLPHELKQMGIKPS